MPQRFCTKAYTNQKSQPIDCEAENLISRCVSDTNSGWCEAPLAQGCQEPSAAVGPLYFQKTCDSVEKNIISCLFANQTYHELVILLLNSSLLYQSLLQLPLDQKKRKSEGYFLQMQTDIFFLMCFTLKPWWLSANHAGVWRGCSFVSPGLQ